MDCVVAELLGQPEPFRVDRAGRREVMCPIGDPAAPESASIRTSASRPATDGRAAPSPTRSLPRAATRAASSARSRRGSAARPRARPTSATSAWRPAGCAARGQSRSSQASTPARPGDGPAVHRQLEEREGVATLTVRPFARRVKPVEGELAQQGVAIEARLAVIGRRILTKLLSDRASRPSTTSSSSPPSGSTMSWARSASHPPLKTAQRRKIACSSSDRRSWLQEIAPRSVRCRSGRSRAPPASRSRLDASRSRIADRPEHPDARRRELDGERKALEAATMARTAARSASWRRHRGGRAWPGRRRAGPRRRRRAAGPGTRARRRPADARGSSRSRAGRAPRGGARRRRRRRGQELLEVVEDEQGRSAAGGVPGASGRSARRVPRGRRAPRRSCPRPGPGRGPGRDRRTTSRPGTGPRPTPRARGRAASCRSPGSGQRQQPRPSEDVAQRRQVIVATDEVRRWGRQVRRRVDRPQRPIVVGDARDDEQVERPRVLEVLEPSRTHWTRGSARPGPGCRRGRRGGLRDGDLPAIRGRRDPCRVVHVDADVVATVVGQSGRSPVWRPIRTRTVSVPSIAQRRHRAAERGGGSEGVGRFGEDREGPVALVLDDLRRRRSTRPRPPARRARAGAPPTGRRRAAARAASSPRYRRTGT